MKKPIIMTIVLFTVQFLAPIFGQTALKAELVVQTGETSLVLSIAFSPDGKLLASGSADETIKLWDVETGQLLKSRSF
jgi:WD40 repeat protein